MYIVIFRTFLRFVLALLVKLTIKKHAPTIIVITGENSSSILREQIYNILSEKYNIRRNLERTESEFSIPLTIIGTLKYQNNLIGWINIIFKTLLQLIYLKPYKHMLILQIRDFDKNIFQFWIKIINPDLILDTSKTRINSKQIIRISNKELTEIINGKLTPIARRICEKYNLDSVKSEQILSEKNFPAPRISLLSAKNNSIIVDARHYYYPPSFTSVIEIASVIPSTKYLISPLKSDLKEIPKEYVVLSSKNIPLTKNAVYIFRGSKDNYQNEIKHLCVNDFEV